MEWPTHLPLEGGGGVSGWYQSQVLGDSSPVFRAFSTIFPIEIVYL